MGLVKGAHDLSHLSPLTSHLPCSSATDRGVGLLHETAKGWAMWRGICLHMSESYLKATAWWPVQLRLGGTLYLPNASILPAAVKPKKEQSHSVMRPFLGSHPCPRVGP